MTGADASSSWSPLLTWKFISVRDDFYGPVKKRPKSQQAPRAHHNSGATGRRCGAGKKPTRHSYSRHAERVTNSQNHSAELDCYCNNERTHEKVWSCCEIFTKCVFELRF